MQAVLADGPFDSPDWLFEPKLDGIRALAFIEDGTVTLRSRRGLDVTAQYPALAQAIAAQPVASAILDGEIIALGENGAPSFERLQQRMNVGGEADVALADAELPVLFLPFDLLYLDGFDLRRVPLADRIQVLARVLRPGPLLQPVQSFEADGVAAYEAAVSPRLRGRHRQAPRRRLPRRPPLAGVAQGEGAPERRLRRRRLARGRGGASRQLRRAAARQHTTRMAHFATRAASARASAIARSASCAHASTRWPPRTTRSPMHRRSRAAYASSGRSWSPRSSSRTGPTTSGCARPSSCACATTSRPRRSCAPTPSRRRRRPPPRRARSPATAATCSTNSRARASGCTSRSWAPKSP